MGCFIACLGGNSGSSTTTKKRKHLKTSHPRYHSVLGKGRYQQLESVARDREAASELKTEKPTLRSVLGAKKKVTFNLNVTTYELLSSNDYSQCGDDDEEEEPEVVEYAKESMSEYPSNYRYKNFIDFEEDENDEDEDDEFDDCLNELEDDHELDCTRNRKLDVGVSEDESFGNADLVLRPVENTAQWRELKVKRTLADPKHQCKENVALDERLHTSMQQEIRVDASLSIWINGNGHQQHNLMKAQTI